MYTVFHLVAAADLVTGVMFRNLVRNVFPYPNGLREVPSQSGLLKIPNV